MYKVTVKHQHPYYRNGDRETTVELLFSDCYKTLREARVVAEGKVDMYSRRYRNGKVHHSGNATYIYTGDTYFDEGTGETMETVYHVAIDKK